MARTRAQAAAQQGLRSPASEDQGKQPQDIQPHKRTPRKRSHLRGQPATKRTERNSPHPSRISGTPSQQDPPSPVQGKGHKRKQPIGDTLKPNPDPSNKQQKTSPTRPKDAFGEPAIGSGAHKHTDPVAFWVKEGRWPDFTILDHLLARKKSLSSLRKRSISATSTTPSDQKPREEKSMPYRDVRYSLLLELKGSFMGKSELGIIDESKTLCQILLETAQAEPQDSLFRADIFESTCRKAGNRNETRIIRDITPLIVPPAEILCTYGASHLKHLIESVNEGWDNSIPLTSTRPQPDYSIGFRRDAFTEDQLAKLSPCIGDIFAGDQSLFMATYYMYFPFLTCEVQYGADVADRQNAHSMTLAVRAIAELFRAVKRKDEVNRKILAFSVSHDRQWVWIYGHYPVIIGENIKYYRHPIHAFCFTALDGRDKWTVYRFMKNVYNIWMPAHFKNICSAIDQLLLDLDLDILPLSKATSVSVPIEQGSQSSNAEQQGVTGSGSVKRRKV
ncbi:hypothetical protein OQA88_13254 [Cercophora sp. LCS_1]